jgi:citrate lyase subunit alpha/citrate CoA-transferase
VVKRVTTLLTPGESIDVLVTDHGIAVNPARPEIRERLVNAGLKVVDIEALYAGDLADRARNRLNSPTKSSG